MHPMTERVTVVSPKWRRKSVMEERGVTVADVASTLDLNADVVRRVIRGPNAHDTRNTKRIKQLIADRVGLTVADLWPEDEPAADTGKPGATSGKGAE